MVFPFVEASATPEVGCGLGCECLIGVAEIA